MPKIIENPKEAILYHAKSIIVDEGYNSLTMRYVSEKSGIAVGTIYNYFPTKKDLTIQLMEAHWYDYITAIEEIDKREDDLFLKLNEIYNKLVSFFETFVEVWVKNTNYGYDDDTKNRKNNFMEKLNKTLEDILVQAQNDGIITLFLDSNETSKFILLNFIMMAQMRQFKYENFEKIY